MPPFKFRLATLLRLREAARDQRRAQLAEALRLDETIRQNRDQIDQQLVSLRRSHQQACAPGLVDVDRLIHGHRYELVLRAERQVTDSQLQALLAEIEQRQQALVAADREVRMLEKLRENQAARHLTDENRREAKTLDELAARRMQEEI